LFNGSLKQAYPWTTTLLEHYAPFLPLEQVSPELSLGEGLTPLTQAKQLGHRLGLARFYFKNEGFNPTWSFKDRGTITALQHAVNQGFKKIGTVSTGNMAVSVAAYGARAGLQTTILVSTELPPEKLGPILIYHPNLIRVDGDYGDLYFKSLEIGQRQQIYFMNSDVPYRVEGSKTIAFEICEQLHPDIPDYVVVPTSAGGNLRGIYKGFLEFKASGLIDKIPQIICAQAAGCAPIFKAWQNGAATIQRVENPKTIAHAIENPYPPSGNAVLRELRQQGGAAVAVTDNEIITAQKELANEGIFGQPAAAVSLAAVQQLRRRKILTGAESVVCIITGSGLKSTAALGEHPALYHRCNLQDVDRLITEIGQSK
jgi:threonine synthase